MKKALVTIWFVLAACGTGDVSAPPVEDPACAGEQEPPASPRAEGLAWDLDRNFDSDRPVCDASNPDCDRMDYTDSVEDDLGVAEALTDPLTSTNKYRTWPGGRIPYQYAKDGNGNYLVNAATRTALGQAMTNWEQLTEGRIKFRPKTATDTAYLLIKKGSPRVRPFVGYRAGQVQEIYLRDTEYITVIKHELGHSIGLHHEQRRTDRLSYIQVRSANIVNTPECRYQFATCTDCKKIGTYDRVSVMHYRTTDLGNCRVGPVLLKLDGSAIDHYWKLSAKDLAAVALMYDAKTTPTPPTPPTPSLPDTGSLVGQELCAGIPDADTTAGAAIETLACDGKGNQDWRITTDAQLRVQHSLQCAAVVGCSTVDATVAQQECSPASPAQKWLFTSMEIVNGMTSKCADAMNATAGAVVGFAACSGTDAQRFAYQPETEAIVTGGLCVTADVMATVGADLTLATCDGRDSQRWFQGRGGFVTRANTARCIRVEGGPATGKKLELGDCTDAIDQRWALRGPIQDSRSSLCLQAASMAASPVTLAPCDASTPQIWNFWSR